MKLLPARMFLVLTIASVAYATFSSTLAIISNSKWKSCLPLDAKLRSFSGISLRSCKKKCGRRPNCASLNYITTGKTCHLLSAVTLATPDMATERSCVNVRRSDIPPKHVCDATAGNCIVKECEVPRVAMADIIGNMYTFGSRIKVDCHVGYRASIDLPIVCGEDGTWTNIPTCVNKCPDPPQIKNAGISEGGNSVGDERTYTCNDGTYTLYDIVSDTIRCKQTNRWTLTDLECIIDCEEPDELKNASLITNGTTVEGSELYYKCDQGFGTPFNTTYVLITCQETGHWTSPSSSCSETATSTGVTSFVFAVLPNFKSENNNVSIYIVSSYPTNIELMPFQTSFEPIKSESGTEIVLSDYEFISVPNELYQHHQRGLHLKSDAPVGVYVENVRDLTTGGTVIYPEEYLSNEYILLSWNNHTTYKAELVVVGTVDGTQVTIEFANSQLIPSAPIPTLLNRFQTYRYQTMHDISGTFIRTSNNVAVFAGHECTHIADIRCDHLTEQMPPISDLQTEYIVSYSYPRHDYLIRIIAVENNTEISLSNGTSLTLNRTNFAQYLFDGIPVAIKASNKIMVAAYTRAGQSRRAGLPNQYDASMLIVPGLSQFRSEYNMLVPVNVLKSVLMITYPSFESNTNNLRLNHSNLDIKERVDVTMVGHGIYTILYIEIPPGNSVIYTVDGKPFGAYISFHRKGAESWFSLPYKL